MPPTHCVVQNCKTTILNKAPGVTFHPCPQTSEMRNKWLSVLKNKCSNLNWAKSKICSKHFENKHFNSQRKLKQNAIPTIFPRYTGKTQSQEYPKSKVTRLLNNLTQAELTLDIKISKAKLKEPSNFDDFVTDDLKCQPDAPVDAHLWLLIKKQENLNSRLMDLVVQTKKHVEILQNDRSDTNNKKDDEQTIESLKYVVKCLQEKHATLEEQIEILTAVESR